MISPPPYRPPPAAASVCVFVIVKIISCIPVDTTGSNIAFPFLLIYNQFIWSVGIIIINIIRIIIMNIIMGLGVGNCFFVGVCGVPAPPVGGGGGGGKLLTAPRAIYRPAGELDRENWNGKPVKSRQFCLCGWVGGCVCRQGGGARRWAWLNHSIRFELNQNRHFDEYILIYIYKIIFFHFIWFGIMMNAFNWFNLIQLLPPPPPPSSSFYDVCEILLYK